jgi:hypothetical protein
VSTTPRSVVEAAALTLLQSLAGLPTVPSVRVVAADDRLACLVLVWDAATRMPTAGGHRARGGTRRLGCRHDILAAVRAAGRPLTRKQLVRILRDARAGHGPGTVAKALADLTAAGELVNRRDKRGYRLPDWPGPAMTPSLFP